MKGCLILLSILFALPFHKKELMAQHNSSFVFNHVLRSGTTQEKHINFVFQDSRGFVWLATRKGVCRYDGLTFKYFNTLGPGGLSDWVATNIEEDKNGNIWIATESGLNKFDPFSNKITQYTEGTGPGTIPFNWCNSLFKDSRGKLWLTTEKGLAEYDETSNTFINYPVKLFDKDERINKFIRNIVEDAEGNLWLSASFGIKKFDPRNKTFTSYVREGTNNRISDNAFYSVFIDHNGVIWAGTFSGALLRFNPDRQEFWQPDPLQVNRGGTVSDIEEIKAGNDYYLLLATETGLYYKKNNEPSGSFYFSPQPGKKQVIDIIYDREQQVWLGCTDGLYKLNNNSLTFNWHSLPSDADDRIIYHIIPVINNQEEFYLTTVKGWFRFNAKNGLIKKEIIPLTSNRLMEFINRWQKDENGYWFTSVNGFGYYNALTNKVTDHSEIVRQYAGRVNTGFIVEVAPGKYWISITRSGILEYDNKTGKHRHLFADRNNPDHTYGYDISDMVKHPDGKVYLVARKKLYCIDPVTLSYKTYIPAVTDNATSNKTYPLKLLINPDKQLLICSDLKIYSLENDQLKSFYPRSGFLQHAVSRLVNADSGYWLHSDQQVFKIDRHWKEWQNIRQLLGWEDSVNVLEIHSALQGKTIFATVGAVGLLDNSALVKKDPPNKVLLSSVRGGRKELYLPANAAMIRPAFKDAIEIDLSPVDFKEGNRLYYRLRGWNEEWSELRNTSVVRYEQLPPGHYTFESKAASTNGAESPITTLRIRVIPPFYLSWWFISGALLLLATAIYVLYRYKLTKAIEMERMRTRIATDLHDDIGATLSSISMYSEAVKNQVKEKMPHLESVLNKMGANSREMVTSMSDIVWAINPDNDSGVKLTQRMESHARDICAVNNVQLHFNADEKLNDTRLSLEQRKNIYLIFKEALNNAMKYSMASVLNILVSLRNNELHLSVTDNGKGFKQDTQINGNGLKNMKQRAEEISGTLTIQSSQNEGTRIILNCPV